MLYLLTSFITGDFCVSAIINLFFKTWFSLIILSLTLYILLNCSSVSWYLFLYSLHSSVSFLRLLFSLITLPSFFCSSLFCLINSFISLYEALSSMQFLILLKKNFNFFLTNLLYSLLKLMKVFFISLFFLFRWFLWYTIFIFFLNCHPLNTDWMRVVRVSNKSLFDMFILLIKNHSIIFRSISLCSSNSFFFLINSVLFILSFLSFIKIKSLLGNGFSFDNFSFTFFLLFVLIFLL